MSQKYAGLVAETWTREFATRHRILSNQTYALEEVVPLLESRLQLRLQAARIHIDRYVPYGNQWIDLILSGEGLPRGTTEQKKIELCNKLLDTVVATDLFVKLKDHQGQERLIAIDVTADPDKVKGKLNTIQGRRADGDPKRLNRNRNLPEMRDRLGIDKHFVLAINEINPPTDEKLLAELHGFVNLPSQTSAINLWQPATAIQAQTPQQLWQRYSQEAPRNSDLQRQIAIAEAVMRDGLADKLPAILAHDPFTQKIWREQGEQKARQHIQVIVQAVSTKLNAANKQRSPQKDKGRGKEKETER